MTAHLDAPAPSLNERKHFTAKLAKVAKRAGI